MTRMFQAAAAAFVVLVPMVAEAHVSITPRESTQGITEKYVIRIPTEGDVATTGAEIEFPVGVVVETIQAPAGWTYDVERENGVIAAMTIHATVKPGEFIEVGFVARNPRQAAQIVWILRQRFADGTVTDWTVGPTGTRPTAVTRLVPPPQR